MKSLKWLDAASNNCGQQINSWDKRISKVLAYRYPCCEACIAREYDMDIDVLRERMEHYLGIRPCLGL